ncbi:ADP-ribosylglycohydrolase family protein [Chryseobacterium sp. Ch-15]|uniref:ADP-ribosylglycohydrolase family protein n=1 Tax=Chryseobacterium muglaense TaxID=2893752 RepID=A0A9Q3YRR5_9FLAO|nr:ADP-ribosylglycohydrolase family protein [Chryseobacterium muglaense]MBD3904397.1 ADP-ribosylglycohydrolase family protein [Chryseobacterium muglaense]MCC9035286.1 ADP-ribosylglycohydrolase family protein [Chryseobacterium muglaense]MCM2554049.1 ADP-ribosylglycohydrolase family protein [Chryseobacterium muglaense]
MKDKLLLASKSLTGISIGDAFGESFFGEENLIKSYILQKIFPESSLEFTDDTIMAIAVFKSLEKFGKINQDFLAEEFTKNYYLDISRGYGPSMHQYFRAVKEGESWKAISYSKFEGQGSMGNGGAMRASVVGAYFYDNFIKLKLNAELSCKVTHANKEAIEGTKAIAVAAAFAVQEKLGSIRFSQQDFIQKIQNELDDSDMKSKLNKALYLDGNPSIELLVKTLGNGINMTAQDTIPIVVWMLSRYRNNFEECLWNTVSALGDRDTTCAMAGGVSILCCDEKTIPTWIKNVENWKNSRFYEN